MIDTSTDDSIVAAFANGISSQEYSHSRASHSGVIFSHIDAVLSRTGIGVGGIDLLGVGTGPGSFTGLRIAVSTMRMIAQLTGKPLIGIHSQYLFASALSRDPSAGVREGDILISAFDAKKSRVFAGVYRALHNGIETLLPAGDYYPSEVADKVPDGSRVTACGNGAGLMADLFSGTDTFFSAVDGFLPGAEGMARAFTRRYEENPAAFADYSATLPFYARKSDAEILHYQKLQEKIRNA